MSEADLVVLGTLCLPDAEIRDAYIAIADGKVIAIGDRRDAPPAKERLDAPGSLLLPGVIDSHVHSLGAPLEGFLNSTSAAVAGGVTTIVDMGSDLVWPSPTTDIRTTPEALKRKFALIEGQAMCDYALWASATPESLPDLERMAGTGIVGFKMFMADSRRSPRMDDGALLEAFERIQKMDLIAAVHAENAEVIRHLIARYQAAGQVESRFHGASRPEVAEIEAVSRAIYFAEATGVHLHILHTSLPESVELARRRALDGVRITVETSPHYLVLSEEDLNRMGSIAKIQPPLRRPEKLERMWDLVRDGWVDTIGTDHAGHALETKQGRNVFENHAGMPGVQTLLPLLFSEGVVKRGFTMQWLVTLLCANPARLFRLYPRKGTLLPGSDADLVVWDPHATWRLAANDLRQAAGYTPYEGMEVTGRPLATVCRGEIVVRDGVVVGKPGRGRFIPVGGLSERLDAFTVGGWKRKSPNVTQIGAEPEPAGSA